MGQIDLAATMDELADIALDAALVTNAYAYPTESATVPCLIVGYPTAIDYDTTFQRGGDALEIPLYFLVGKTGTKDARDALSAMVAGAASVKATYDGAQSFGSVRVESAEVTEVTVAAVTYLGLKFSLDIRT